MPKKKVDTALRELAADTVDALIEADEIPEWERDNIATSLVRQWITCDGKATLFLRERQQVFLILGTTPLGKPCITPASGAAEWNQLTDDWKINPDDLPEIFEQLNRGQSAEVTNEEGIPLRVWVDPKRGRGVETLVQQKIPADWKRDRYKIAGDILRDRLGATLDAEEIEALACSVAKQWQRFGGFASIFHNDEQFIFTITELGEGNCRVAERRRVFSLASELRLLGFAPEAITRTVACINLGREVEVQDKAGIPARLR